MELCQRSDLALPQTMRRVLRAATFLLPFLVGTAGAAQAAHQANHLIITEVGYDTAAETAGASAEFIEIYNPTDSTITLNDGAEPGVANGKGSYFISDSPANYYTVVNGKVGMGTATTDSVFQFPVGFTLGPKQTVVFCADSTSFLTEMFGNSLTRFTSQPGSPKLLEGTQDGSADGVPDMIQQSQYPLGNFNPLGLTNSSEPVILYYWNGQNDLIQDVDMVVWGTTLAEAPAKTASTCVDGPDTGTTTTCYKADGVGARAAGSAGGNVNSLQRRSREEASEADTAGNGITGQDEAGENWSTGSIPWVYGLFNPGVLDIRADGSVADALSFLTAAAVSSADGPAGTANPADYGADGTLTELYVTSVDSNYDRVVDALYVMVRGDLFGEPDTTNANVEFVMLDVDPGQATGVTALKGSGTQLSDLTGTLDAALTQAGFELSSDMIARKMGFDAAMGIDVSSPASFDTVGWRSWGTGGTTGSQSDLAYKGAYTDVRFDGAISAVFSGATGTTYAAPDGYEGLIKFADLAATTPTYIALTAVTSGGNGSASSPNMLPENASNAYVYPQTIEATICYDVTNRTLITYYTDSDADGYGSASRSGYCGPLVAGVSLVSNDCDDTRASVSPGGTESCDGLDNNCDGVVDEGVKTTFYLDSDGDGYGLSGSTTQACSKPGGYVATTGDCDDTNASANPSAVEVCDGADNNCNGNVDEGVKSTFYLDSDGDGYGVETSTTQACSKPNGYATVATDCNDTNGDISPGGTEACDAIDSNCNGSLVDTFADFDVDAQPDCIDTDDDNDGDPDSSDCNDVDPEIYTNASELCNGKDDDCDGTVDDGALLTWYKDTDGDGYGSASSTTPSCTLPPGYVQNSLDCDDSDKNINPSTSEISGDGKDQNCDGKETCFKDQDDDGYRPNSSATQASSDTDCNDSGEALSSEPTTDCNDADASIHPSATETCNEVDDNCDGQIDEGVQTTFYQDTDGDTYGTTSSTIEACSAPAGYVSQTTDCNDADSNVHPGATELAGDELDQNCDGKESCYKDGDGDGYRPDSSTITSSDLDCRDAGEARSGAPSGDCNDADAATNPAASEACNGNDDDCDGATDEGVKLTFYLDSDGDTYGDLSNPSQACKQPAGYVSNSADCNDADQGINPAATEGTGDGRDQNCDGKETCFADADDDGYRPDATATVASSDVDCSDAGEAGSSEPTTDCNDADSSIHPGATETCNNKDDNCNGSTDENVQTIYYRDSDGDGYGDALVTSAGCSPGQGFVATNTDCNDKDVTVHPAATEVSGDSKDQNCDGKESCFKDADDDGYRPDLTSTVSSSDTDCNDGAEATTSDPEGDCNDTDKAVNPGATETCNGKDDDCDASTDEGVKVTYYLDADGDTYGDPNSTVQDCALPAGHVSNAIDCNDADKAINPAAPEQVGDEVDQNCDGKELCYRDSDGDGYRPTSTATLTSNDVSCSGAGEASAAIPSGDCNDANASVHPGMSETCNEVDDNCDGAADEGVMSTFHRDADGDTYGETQTSIQACSAPAGYVADATDCNDANKSVNPGATEVVGDNLDQSCDGKELCYSDVDGDGYRANDSATSSSADADCTDPGEATALIPTGDCDDADKAVSPAAPESCNGKDDDCDGQTDNGVLTTYYRDVDEDSYGDSGSTSLACAVPAGFVSRGGDCNDTDPAINPGAVEACNGKDDNCDGLSDDGTKVTYYRDSDGDGFGDVALTTQACEPPTGYVSSKTDCNDSDSSVNPDAAEVCNSVDDNCDAAVDEGVKLTWYRDNDADGYGDASSVTQACNAPPGYVSSSTDCDDGDSNVHPSATESCNLIDDDCNGATDEGVQSAFYLDQDSDGFGNAQLMGLACTAPSGFVSDATDCDDTQSTVYPGATESCNGIDDSCNGSVDENATSSFYVDADADGVGAGDPAQACSAPTGMVASNDDCDDGNATVYPNAPESCDGLDNDCDAEVDEGALLTFYVDADQDGFGDNAESIESCGQPDGYVEQGGDCDDSSALISPAAEEVPYDGTDQDCQAGDLVDIDQDGFPSTQVIDGTDCDDNAASIHPEAEEVLNGSDDNCDSQIDEGTPGADLDQDGYSVAEGDCDDARSDVHPYALEVCDKIDQDCDQIPDDGTECFDDDQDGYSEDGSIGSLKDCDDTNAQVHPSAVEFKDGLDNDCNGLVDDGVDSNDDDGDGFSEADGDCDDTRAAVYPGAVEACDGLDQDCNGKIDDGTGCQDDDKDGYSEDEGDCNDTDDAVHPGAAEGLSGGAFGALEGDGIDNDCDELIDEGTDAYDDDQDGLSELKGDCRDDAASIYPGAAESCNGADDDCDTVVDEASECADDDQDGFSEDGTVGGQKDCNDADASIYPGAVEVHDGVDNNCDGIVDEGEPSPTPEVTETPEPSQPPEETGTPQPTPGCEVDGSCPSSCGCDQHGSPAPAAPLGAIGLALIAVSLLRRRAAS